MRAAALLLPLLLSAAAASQDARTVYDFDVQSAAGSTVPLRRFRAAKVLLLVNTASKCGFTPQYAGLEELYRKFGGKGLEIVAFPCNQFGGQEPGTDEEVQEFVRDTYGVTFPVMGKIEVNGDNEHPLYTWLKEHSAKAQVKQAAWAPNPEHPNDIQWNFSKFLLVGGVPVRRYDFDVTPADIEADIRAALANVLESEL
eukprot:TRINITY_DN5632_c0_g5_i1.p1 TRINITY_DN5632_c0_g5~~TRINITY_DN5632_c0_g5_i1.p1  ORF type:complete len:199 (+),score=80.69 TRINITY_DN5632_c0_g5_i1:44-640(+)